MAKRLQKEKYTIEELNSYTKTQGSCVKKINTNLHISIGPYALADFKKSILAHIAKTEIGYYNVKLDGIVLDIKNIKVLGSEAAMRFDDPKIHININADCYVFRPEEGAVLSGIVKHISSKHVGAIIYRVFSVTIQFSNRLDENDVELDEEVQFKINNFNMQNVFPVIEGELVLKTTSSNGITQEINQIKLENDVHDNSAADSGIEEKESTELDALISLIKQEPTSEMECDNEKKINKAKKKKRTSKIAEEKALDKSSTETVESAPKKKSKKQNTNDSSSQEETTISIKEEPSNDLHAVDNIFKCDICEKLFKNQRTLYIHKYIHSTVKRFACKDCGLAYAQSSGLSYHRKMKHQPPASASKKDI